MNGPNVILSVIKKFFGAHQKNVNEDRPINSSKLKLVNVGDGVTT